MPGRELVGALVFLALGAAGLYWAVDLPFGDARLPGPAMLPSTLSALIIVFAAVHLARALRRMRAGAGSAGGPAASVAAGAAGLPVSAAPGIEAAAEADAAAA
ncbi:MAG: hypothetical protein JSW68_02250, partial [Burkholderiales bacterium]